MKPSRCYLLLVVLTTLVLVRCAAQSDTMDAYLNSTYGNKLDLQSFISNDHEFLTCKVKNGRAIVEARVTTDEIIAHGYSMFVLVIDLATKKLINKIESPVEP